MTSLIKRGEIKGSLAVAGAFALAGGLALSGTTAEAGIVGPVEYVFYQDQGTGFENTPNDLVGELVFVDSVYNPTTQRMTWEIGYDTTDDGKLPEGYVLAVNDGPMPKEITGYLAAIYFDATNPASPTVSAYTYNGDNSATSHEYGTFEWVYDAGTDTWSPPTDAPDPIASTLDAGTAGFVNSAMVDDSDPRADRVFKLDLDASQLNSHTPLYPNDGPGYLGAAYNTSIGLWLHPFVDFNSEYDSNGYLSQWEFDRSTYGWFDFTEGEAREVPEPAAALIALPLLALARRRK